MSIIDVFQVSYEQLSSEQQELLKGEILKEIKEEFLLIHDIDGGYPISLKKALGWIGKKYNNKQYQQKKDNWKRSFLAKNPFFERAWNPKDPGKMYTEKKERSLRDIYFSIKGFEYWCMTQNTPKANAIKAYFTNTIHNYHQEIKKENQNLKKENKDLKQKVDLDFVTQKFRMFSEQIFRVDSELKKLKEIYEMKESQKGKVYFIHEVGSEKGFKIGFTRRELGERLAELQTGSLRDLEVHRWIPYQDCQKFEKHMHDCFAEKHIRGEWYDLTSDAVESLVEFLMN
jgi:hypothetical protein